MSAADCVRVETVVEIDPAAAFELFTREVDAWWRAGPRYRPGGGRNGVMRFEPGVGGRLLESYDDGAEPVELGRIAIWEPPKRLVFDWRQRNFRAGEVTRVEVRFEADGSGTRVTLEHRGWDAVALDHPARHGLGASPAFTRMIGSFWGDLMMSLRGVAARRGTTLESRRTKS